MIQTRSGKRTLPSALVFGAILVLGAALWLLGRVRSDSADRAPPAAGSPSHTASDERDGYDVTFLRQVFGAHAGYRFHPIACLLNKPSKSDEYPWPEHAGGTVVIRTNELGFREDERTDLVPHGRRVLVAGDSHTAGVIENADSFVNVAERLLRSERNESELELINAGVGNTGPICYLGVLREYLRLQPQAFVSAIFVGNDFLDDLYFQCALGRWVFEAPPQSYLDRMAPVSERFEGPVSQGLNQAYRFRQFPAEAERAFAAVLDSVVAMHELCRSNGLGYVLLLLPARMDVDEDDRERWLEACRDLGLEEADAHLGLALGKRLVDAARARGVECLDPTEEMQRSREVLYWKKDYHLSDRGHALVGELLAQRLNRLFDVAGPNSAAEPR